MAAEFRYWPLIAVFGVVVALFVDVVTIPFGELLLLLSLLEVVAGELRWEPPRAMLAEVDFWRKDGAPAFKRDGGLLVVEVLVFAPLLSAL